MLLQPLVLLGIAATAAGSTIDTKTEAELRDALRKARPGTTIRIAPGRYRGDLFAENLKGTPDQPITIQGLDPRNPPLFEQGTCALQFSKVAHLVIQDLQVEQMSGNGINIDDAGAKADPSHHILLRNLTIRDVGPRGNHDGLKLSGIQDFRVESCRFERWGSGGSGIDMVGCKRGQITRCTFRHGDTTGDNGVQAKGGSEDISIMRCRFEHAGFRAINLGGSTGLNFFRPEPQGHEAKNLTVEDCEIIGSHAAIAFVGIDGATVRHNTIYHPFRYAIRILQETNAPGFVPSRRGVFTDNLIVFRSSEMAMPINIGPNTAPETFSLARNAWYCSDQPNRSRPQLPIKEAEGIYGRAPRFRDAASLDLTLPADQPIEAGARRAN